MAFLERVLEHIAIFQKKYTLQIFIFAILFSIIMVAGIFKVSIQTDMNKEMPQQLPIYQLNDKIRDKFGGQDSVFVVLTIDENTNLKNAPRDIRDPSVISYMISLEDTLKEESSIEGVTSAASYLRYASIPNLESVKAELKRMPQVSALFSKDYKTTVMFITTDVGSSEEKIHALTRLINEKTSGLAKPPGVRVMYTGTPPMRMTILGLLNHDAVFTISLASIIILFLLFLTERSVTKGLLVFVPLFLGLIWTMGTMGWIGMKLSIATVGLGAMILGLGVEYGVFMYTRYKEERDKDKDQLESLRVSVPAVGTSILGSGLTTIVGFLALALSFFPMMQHLGITLALGITYCLIVAVIVSPVIFLLEEDFEYWYIHLIYNKITTNVNRFRGKK
jgi:hydrophobe/amphiphile efflux-3 (HAE3) family protein